MANRVRLVLELGGKYYRGPELGRVLPQFLPYTKPPVTLTGWKKLQWMVENLPGTVKRKLWILREPRRYNSRKSRYVEFGRQMGLGKDLRKYKKAKGVLNPYTVGTIAHERYAQEIRRLRDAVTIQQRPAASTGGVAPRPRFRNLDEDLIGPRAQREDSGPVAVPPAEDPQGRVRDWNQIALDQLRGIPLNDLGSYAGVTQTGGATNANTITAPATEPQYRWNIRYDAAVPGAAPEVLGRVVADGGVAGLERAPAEGPREEPLYANYLDPLDPEF